MLSPIFVSADAQWEKLLSVWRMEKRRVVFTNGCFDVLHRGHVEYLACARKKGDVMIVGLNSDDSVRRLKGPTRPVNDFFARATVLAALRSVDAVVGFDDDTPLRLIELVRPDVLVKGSDYRPENIVGADVVLAYGGRVQTVDLTPGFSTTTLIEKMRN